MHPFINASTSQTDARPVWLALVVDGEARALAWRAHRLGVRHTRAVKWDACAGQLTFARRRTHHIVQRAEVRSETNALHDHKISKS